MKKPLHKQTQAIRAQQARSQHREHSAPLYLTSSFTFENAEQARALFQDEIQGNIYSRFSNPNNDEFINKLCLLEDLPDGIATATGMAAMFISIAALANSGDHIIASRSLFGSTHQILTSILPRWNISHTLIDITAPKADWQAAIQPNTRILFVESPSNPGLDLVDLEMLGDLANKHNLIFSVDNCFATPILQNPAKWGAHIVTHSATKMIDGQGRVLGGAVLGSRALIQEIRFFARHTGPAMSPFHSWLLSKSLETLALRVEKQSEQAVEIAARLGKIPGVQQVKYPFLKSHPQFALAKKQMQCGGSLLTFVLEGGIKRAQQFMDKLEWLSLTANLGDTRTIVTHPATTTHSKLSESERAAAGISPGLLRLSVGLEHPNDILADIEQAIRASTRS